MRDQLSLVNGQLSANTESVSRELQLIRAELAQSVAQRAGELDQSSQRVLDSAPATPAPGVTTQEMRTNALDDPKVMIGATVVATVLLVACLLNARTR